MLGCSLEALRRGAADGCLRRVISWRDRNRRGINTFGFEKTNLSGAMGIYVCMIFYILDPGLVLRFGKTGSWRPIHVCILNGKNLLI